MERHEIRICRVHCKIKPVSSFQLELRKISFFDKVVYKRNNNRPRAKLFTKPIGRRHNYQQKHSEHPENLKKAFPIAKR